MSYALVVSYSIAKHLESYSHALQVKVLSFVVCTCRHVQSYQIVETCSICFVLLAKHLSSNSNALQERASARSYALVISYSHDKLLRLASYCMYLLTCTVLSSCETCNIPFVLLAKHLRSNSHALQAIVAQLYPPCIWPSTSDRIVTLSR